MIYNHILICYLLWAISLGGFQTKNVATEKEQANYFVLPYMSVNHLTNGTILAIPRKGESMFIDAQLVKGTLPLGVSLFSDGTIAVVDNKILEPGKYKFKVAIVDDKEIISTVKVKLKIGKQNEKQTHDKIPSVRILKPKRIEDYRRGEVIARAVDPDGTITKAEVVRGKLPEGLYLTHNGKISVNDPSKLSAGNYTFWICVEDNLKGCDFIILSLSIGNDTELITGKQ